jgi:ATP-binding cassette subfamily B protein
MYDPSAGKIFIDDVDLRTIALQSLRSGMSYVPQDGFLFSDSVEKNIGFGIAEIKTDEAREAARQAAVDKDIISFAKGYQTLVGERGVTLSGGQKQRVSIARALAKKSAVLILDDSLSAVDSKTEQEILDNIRQYMQGRTAILITHKITGLADFDKIVVLDEGRIAECGTHHELILKDGLYAAMYLRQKVQHL